MGKLVRFVRKVTFYEDANLKIDSLAGLLI